MAGLNQPDRVSEIISSVEMPSVPSRRLRDLAQTFADRDPTELRREVDDSARARAERERADLPVPDRFARHIPDRFKSATFENYKPVTDSQQSALITVQRWVDRVVTGKPSLLALVGETGTGKSHLLYAAAREFAKLDFWFYSRPWYRLANELRYGGQSPYADTPAEPAQVRSFLWEAKVALIDEVRPTASTAFDDTELAIYACHAYDSLRSALVTTNVNPLKAVMGPAAASRFTQIEIVGPDRRQQR